MQIKSSNLPGQSVFRSVTSSRASILIITLWVLFMLAAMAVTLGYSVRQKLSLAVRLEQRDKARFMSWANIRLALTEIMKKEKKVFLSQEDYRFDRTYEGVRQEDEEQPAFIENIYAIFDEERKININKADMHLMERLFKILLG